MYHWVMPVDVALVPHDAALAYVVRAPLVVFAARVAAVYIAIATLGA